MESNDRQENIDFFKWLLSKEKIDLEQTLDFTLCSSKEDANIYYPKEIGRFFETLPMKRLSKILQLGNLIDYNSNLYHTRFEHCMGVYNQKKAILIDLWKNDAYRSYVEKNDLKLYLLAELIKSAGHDIGHLPLSHIMEISVINQREFHEVMGKRILLENPEIQQCLKDIDNRLPEVLKEVLENDTLGLKFIDEGNYDIDRYDYITRDSLYGGKKSDSFFRKFELLEIEENGELKTVPVFDISSLDAIEDFLSVRHQQYENLYYNPLVQIKDATVAIGVNNLIQSKSKTAEELQFFLQHLIDNKQSPKSIDLQQYLLWDDLKFYNQIVDAAENAESKELREMATLILPNMEAFMNMLYTMMSLNKVDMGSISDEDKKLLKKIKNLILCNTELSKKLKNKNYLSESVFYTEDIGNIEVLQNIKNVFLHSQKLKTYKLNEPIYVRYYDGKIYTLDKLPDKHFRIEDQDENISVAFCFPNIFPVKEEIASNYMEPVNPRRLWQKKEVNMSPLQTGHKMEDVFVGIEL